MLGAVWAGAQLATFAAGGSALGVGAAETIRALTRLPSHASDPEKAWPAGAVTAAPVLYWVCTIVVVATIVALIGGIAWMLAGPGPGTRRGSRLGVDTRARLARRRDLRALIVRKPTPGRLILGRSCGALVAPEDRHGA